MSNATLYFSNFKRIRINSVKKIAIRMFFYFCFSCSLSWFVSVCPFSWTSTATFYSKKYTSVLILSLFKALCCCFIFSAENIINSGITTYCSFFSIKLILLNLKSDLSLIVSGFDNLVCIVIEIGTTSLTYIDFSLHLIILNLSIL